MWGLSALSARRHMMTATAMAIVVTATPAIGQTRTFSVSEQGAAQSIPIFAKQAGVQIIASGHVVRTKKTNSVKGHYTAEQALRIFLQGTGLEAANVDSSAGIITIRETTQSAQVPHATKQSFTEPAIIEQDIIVVTAQKREEKLQDVPISISVLRGAKLDSSSDSVVDQLSRVPGVAAADTAYGSKQLTIRGVSSTSDWFSGTSTVGYYLDSVPFGFVRQGFVPDSNAYDLERVEILRGPQGTLYGVSALNGVVRVLTAEPDLEKFALKMRALGSTTKDGEGGYRGDGAINIPLVSGKLAVRSVVSYERNPGWIDGPTGTDINGRDDFTARVKLKAAPTDTLSVTAMLWHTESDAGSPPLSARNRTTIQQIPENSSANYDIVALRAELDLDGFTVTSSTSYMDLTSRSLLSFAPNSVDYLTSKFSSKNFSQEIAINSNSSGAFKWSLGGIYRDVQDLVSQQISLPTPNPRGLAYNDYSKSYAVFGEISYDISDAITLSGGARYFRDRNETRQRENPIDPDAQLINNSERFKRLSPRIVAKWIPSPTLSMYVSYSEGFRSGFSQSPTILSAEPNFPGVQPDYLRNYEFGAKGDIVKGLLSFEGAFFFMDWQGTQQNVLVNIPQAGGALNALINGQSASGLGAELMLTAKPAKGMTLGASYSWNSLKFDADVFTIVNDRPHLLALKGSRLFNSPKDAASMFIDYVFPIGGLDGNMSGSVNYTAPRTARAVVSGVTEVNTSDPIWIARANIGVSSKDQGWSLSLFVENLTDFRGTLAPAAPGQNMADMGFRARPRTIGIQAGFKM